MRRTFQHALTLGVLLCALWVVLACQGQDTPPDPPTRETSTAPLGYREDTSNYGLAVASLGERIYFSDVVVRATLESSANDLLTFQAIEYLKGTGPSQFTVSAETAGRSAQWDNREAVLFLQTGGTTTGNDPDSERSATDTAATFEFTDTAQHGIYADLDTAPYKGTLPDGYTVNSRNPAWLPSTSTNRGQTDDSSTGNPSYITENNAPDGSTRPTASLEAIRAKIEWLSTGDGVTGYADCIWIALVDERYERDLMARNDGTWPIVISELDPIPSGSPAGTRLRHAFLSNDVAYGRQWLTGKDAHLFNSPIVDDDQDPANGYYEDWTTARPLPAGRYEFFYHRQDGSDIPCDYTASQTRVGEQLEVTPAQENSVLEAFFDPQTIGSGNGYIVSGDVSTGDLSATDFTVIIGNVSTSITALTGDASNVVMGLSPYNTLAGHTLDFITGDGTASLSLDAGEATGDSTANTLTWAVGSAPWSSGDDLMLRISVDRPPFPARSTTSAIAGQVCDGATGTAFPGNTNLHNDCTSLIEAVVGLSGITDAVNWSPTSDMDLWDGITLTEVGGVHRLTGVDLRGKGVSGALSGSWADLHELTSLKLNGNTFTGCVPPWLYFVKDHDLNSLGLGPCG